MNQRIRQLTEQAIGDVDYIRDDDVTNEELSKMYIPDCFAEKFAELIVKETMQVVANNLPQNTYLDVADAVIEHFGVRE